MQSLAILCAASAFLNMLPDGSAEDVVEATVLYLKVIIGCVIAAIALHVAARIINASILIRAYDGKEYGSEALWYTSNGYGGQKHPLAFLDEGRTWEDEDLKEWLSTLKKRGY